MQRLYNRANVFLRRNTTPERDGRFDRDDECAVTTAPPQATPATIRHGLSPSALAEFTSQIDAASRLANGTVEAVPGLVDIEQVWTALALHTQELDHQFLEPHEVTARFFDVQLPRLTALPDPTRAGHYLHASWINFGLNERMIASQKPLPSGPMATAEALWLTVLKHDIPLIVDLTNPSDNEDGDYAPAGTDDMLRFHGADVKLTRVEYIGRFRIETIVVESKDGSIGKVAAIKRLHFLYWPDHGVIAASELIALADVIRAICPRRAHMLAHCRAGVGRTGTLLSFLAASDALQEAGGSTRRDSGTLHDSMAAALARTVVAVVLAGRRDRGPGFVQTRQQFALLVEALLLQQARTSTTASAPVTVTPAQPTRNRSARRLVRADVAE